MPGLTLAQSYNAPVNQYLPDAENLMDGFVYSHIHDHFRKEILVKEEKSFIACTKHNQYPINTYQQNGNTIWLEGKIYDRGEAELKQDLFKLADLVFHPDGPKNSQINSWLWSTDGDFIIILSDEASGKKAVLNDALGRLPIYFFVADDFVLVSREFRLYFNMQPKPEVDKHAAAQYLLFNYSLSRLTHLKNVFRADPAQFVFIDPASRSCKVETLHRYNFEIKQHTGVSFEKNVDTLIELFNKATRLRSAAEGTQNVMSLSGGLDSRSVVASMVSQKVPFIAATYHFPLRKIEADVKTASELVEKFGIPWEKYQLGKPDGAMMMDQLKMKGGLNWLKMAFIFEFFRKFMANHGDKINWYNGNGGHKAMPDPRPSMDLRSPKELLSYILYRSQFLPLQDVAGLTGLSINEMLDEIMHIVDQYPEKSFNQKYVHFMVYEKGFKRVMEGEDRNRNYFWTVTPFYGVDYFDYAMNVPDEQKSAYKLYRAFINGIEPGFAEFIDPKWGAELNDPNLQKKVKRKGQLMTTFFKMVPTQYHHRIINTFKGKKPFAADSNFVNCLRMQMESTGTYDSVLNTKVLKRMLENQQSMSQRETMLLITLVSMIEYLETGHSSLEHFLDQPFE